MNENYYQQNNYQQPPVQQYYAPAPKKSNAKFLLPVAIFAAQIVTTILNVIRPLIDNIIDDYTVSMTVTMLFALFTTVCSTAIYVGFAFAAYKNFKGRVIFLGAAFVATRCYTLVNNFLGIFSGIFLYSNSAVYSILVAIFGFVALAAAMVAAYFIVDFIEKKILREETAAYYAPAQPVYQQPQAPAYGEENAQQYNNY